MDAAQEIEIPEFPKWDRSWGFSRMEDPILAVSHREVISSDFALSWLWGEYQRWKFVEQTSSEPDQKNIVRFLHSARTLLLVALHMKYEKDLPPDFSGNFEDIWEMKDAWEAKHGTSISVQHVVDSRLNQNGGWDADKMGINLRDYEKLCANASYDWQDSFNELNFNPSA